MEEKDMKKTVTALCVLTLLCALTFAGCGNNDNDTGTSSTRTPGSSATDTGPSMTLPQKENGEITDTTGGNGVLGDLATDVSSGIADMSGTSATQ